MGDEGEEEEGGGRLETKKKGKEEERYGRKERRGEGKIRKKN